MSKNPASSANELSVKPLGIAVIGAGVVGGGVLAMLARQAEKISAVCGRPIEVVHVVKRRVGQCEHLPSEWAGVVSDDWQAAVADPNTDVVVELMGGTTTATDCIRAALLLDKPVVTANKALLAEAIGGDNDMLALARQRGVPLLHEASIAGCIPIVQVLQHALVGDSIREMYGVINGTCNYILTAMAQDKTAFAEALAAAQRLGYAEAEPSLDIDGFDAAHKILLATRLAMGVSLVMDDIATLGVRDFDHRDIVYAQQFGFCIKLLAIAKYDSDNNVLECRVRPAMIPTDHLLASVDGATNAIVVRSDFAGETMYYGAGAGAYPTATAVVSDIISLARAETMNSVDVPLVAVTNQRDFSAPFYLRLRVVDQPGVLAAITRLLADKAISIEAIHQNESAPQQLVDVVMLLHTCADSNVLESIAEIENLSSVTEPIIAIPIERIA